MRQTTVDLLAIAIALVMVAPGAAHAQTFVDGLAQPVFSVNGANLITHNVWVEVPNLDTDRIGLMVLSTDRLFTLRPPPGAELTLDTTKSAFILPVVGGASALAAALP